MNTTKPASVTPPPAVDASPEFTLYESVSTGKHPALRRTRVPGENDTRDALVVLAIVAAATAMGLIATTGGCQ